MGESTGMPLQSARATNSLSPLAAVPAEGSDDSTDVGKGFDRLLTADAGPESETASHLHNGAEGKPRGTDQAPPAADANPATVADTSLLSVLAQMPAAQQAPAPVAAAATAPAQGVPAATPTSALPAPGTADQQTVARASSTASSTASTMALPAASPGPASTAASAFDATLLAAATATPAAAQLPASSAAQMSADPRQPAPASRMHPALAAVGAPPLRPALTADALARALAPAEIPHPNPDGMAQWAAGRATQIVQPLAANSAMPTTAVPVIPTATSPLPAVAPPATATSASPVQVIAAIAMPQAPAPPTLPTAPPSTAAPVATSVAEAAAAAAPTVAPVMARNDRTGSAAPQTILPPLLAPSPFPPSSGRPDKVDAPFSFPLADLPATPGLPASQRLPTGPALGDIETALTLPRIGIARPATQPLAPVAESGGIPLQQAVPLTHGLLPTAPQPIAAAAAPPVLTQPADPSAGYDDRFSGHVVWMAGQRISQADIRVSPEHLGNIAIRLQVEGNEVRAEFHSAQPDVRHALEASLPRLRELLGQHGLQLAQAGVGQGQAQGRKPSGNTAASDAPGTDQPLEDAAPAQTPVFRRGRGLLDVYA
ncbi:flagellar hook-length control protein FliK [Thermomonas paludicola]|uniref:flagellar hook-length control protein FliK n=1 Tax=Thermomonas paludicola TaxID=2884874 RepID=UPI002114B80E|nr:flagellar hook-length control protein FliK [Thermomonas paludicola]